MKKVGLDHRTMNLVYSGDAFSRVDESDDSVFYSRDRFTNHLDTAALVTIENLIEELVTEPSPEILDLMASWDSHIKETIHPKRVVGLGLNQKELSSNPILDKYLLHDLNQNPHLPFPENSFDVVLNIISVGYLTHPFEIFTDIERILKPGGLFLVVFSHRQFATKAVKVWKNSSPEEKVLTVQDYFRYAPFEKSRVFVVEGKARPADDKYAGDYMYSDPIYAVYAEKSGADSDRPPRPIPKVHSQPMVDNKVIEQRKAQFEKTLKCPYCSEHMTKWEVPQTPFIEWPNEYMYICFNNFCPYMLEGWEVMRQQGVPGFSYRLAYDPDRNKFFSTPLPSAQVLKEAVIAPRG